MRPFKKELQNMNQTPSVVFSCSVGGQLNSETMLLTIGRGTLVDFTNGELNNINVRSTSNTSVGDNVHLRQILMGTVRLWASLGPEIKPPCLTV